MGGETFREKQRKSWDREYSKKDPLWKGPPSLDHPLPPGVRILELGCGNGKTLEALTHGNGIITAVDFSRNAVRACARGGPQSTKLNLLIADACELPFREASFDMIIAFHILEHLLTGDRKLTTCEIRRVLDVGGKVLVRVFSVEDMRFGKGREVEENTFLRGTGLVYHYFTEAELMDLFQDFRPESLTRTTSVKRFEGKEYNRVELEGVFSIP
jgi:ubiquinone/menaquinone biosynthesis C-methylase UbiE